jgi:hypothetical protein
VSIDSYSVLIPATGVWKFPQMANFLFLLTASAPIQIQLQGGSANETFQGLTGGLRLKRVKLWQNTNITGAAGTTATVYLGSESARNDDTDYIQTIATIAGGQVNVVQQASPNAPTNHADVAVLTTVVDTTIAANAARRSLAIGSLSSNAPATKNLRVQGGAGTAAANGIELQPGTFVTLLTQGAVAVYNPDANTQTYWWQEQT